MEDRGLRLANRNYQKAIDEVIADKDKAIAVHQKTIDEIITDKDKTIDLLKKNYTKAVEALQRVNNVNNTNVETYIAIRQADKHAAEMQKRVIDEQNKMVKEIYEPLLLRLHQMETIALHRSLDYPAMRGYRLPQQTIRQGKTMTDLVAKLHEADDENLKALEDRVYLEEYRFETRTWSLDAWIDGEIVPYPSPRDSPHLVSHRERSRSPPRRDSTPTPFKGYNCADSSTDSGSQGFKMIPAVKREDNADGEILEVGYPCS